MRARILALLLAATAAPAAAQTNVVEVGPGEVIPDVRPCLGYLARGELVQTRAYDDFPAHGDDIIMDAIFHFRFRKREHVFGVAPSGVRELVRSQHTSLNRDRFGDVLVAARRGKNSDSMLDFDVVWRDTRGRPFVPVFAWPEAGSRAFDWRPATVREFARPVRYRNQLAWPGPLTAEADALDLIVTERGRTRVLYGLYLADIPALLRAAANEPCWR